MAEKMDTIKGFKNGTQIMLANGTVKTVEDLTTDDSVLGLDGNAKKITEVKNGQEQLYKVLPKTKENCFVNYEVSGEHVLTLKFTNVECIIWDNTRKRYMARYIKNLKICNKSLPCKDKKELSDKEEIHDQAEQFLLDVKKEIGYNKGGDVIEITVNNYLELSTDIKKSLYGFKEGVEFMGRHVDLDPYMLGLWLGDGTTEGASITNVDKEIIDYINEYATGNNLRVTKVAECRYYIAGIKVGKGHNTFLNQLKQYNLIGNKHIPENYLFNTREVRLKVLAGLLDSDGHFDKNMYEIFQLSDKLANDITKLARSLGFSTSYFKKEKTCFKKDKPNVTGLYNGMYISGTNICDIPCILDRKKAKKCGKDVNFLVTQVGVEKGEVGDCIGFKVEGGGRFFGVDYAVLHDCAV